VEASKNTSTAALLESAKRESGAWGYNWATLSVGDINTGRWTQSWPCSVRKKKTIVRNAEKWKPDANWQIFYGSRKAEF
jgi:hypothetical protein